MPNTDLTFITNDKNKTLLDRFKTLINDTKFFDVLVGYFYTSGFHGLYKSLEKTEKIRILIGISTNQTTINLIQQSRLQVLQFSHRETKEIFSDLVSDEMSESEDNNNVEEGVAKFQEWLRNGKLTIKAYPTQKLHAKLYIMTFPEDDRDAGRVITGSSNFSQSGLVDNLEFNVELKTRSDYEYALKTFNELWENAVDVSDKYIETIQTKTWLNDTITPYQLYLKFLYEYFKEEITQDREVFYKYFPDKFKRLEYQEQAVLNAKKIVEEYGGVFISDVVGLGKTYMAAMLANQLDGRTLVIAPPVLLEENNPGSWKNVFNDFKIAAKYESLGKLDQLVEHGADSFKNIIIDEAHRFRTETNVTYEKLAEICRGKRVILVTATPYNNSPKDILSQIKLFQKGKKSTIPNLPNLEAFFSSLDKKLKDLDRQKDRQMYIETTQSNSQAIREKVLKYIMVRRTRKEIEEFFGGDLKKQNLRFPEVKDPEAVFYEFNAEEDKIFNDTINLITQEFKYARYTPMLYYKGKLAHPEELGQKNMGKFMKILLVKRLESSFFAFKNSINRFIASYERFLQELDKGCVYVSKKHTTKIFELLENDDEESIQRLIEEDKAKKYDSGDFKEDFKKDMEHDLVILKEINLLWSKINRDPKLLKFIKILSENPILKQNKLIVFTESRETAEYITEELQKTYSGKVVAFTGMSSSLVREKVIDNFDAKVKSPKDEYRILIATEVLSEGVNLHRSNVVINYDIPWNPTRLMQRVGRINRVDTEFDKIYTFNFFPTVQSNNQIKLKEAAEAKIHAFISLLGADAQLLTDGEPIESHELFNRLISKNTVSGEDGLEESELKYLQIIRDIRDNQPDLFARIKRLPKKARTGKIASGHNNELLTYFRKGKTQKFFLADKDNPQELGFLAAAKLLEETPQTPREKPGADFYALLDKNKQAFDFATQEEAIAPQTKRGRDNAAQLLKILKAIKDLRQFTDDQEIYFNKVIRQLEEGGLPKQTAKNACQEVNDELKNGINPLKILAVLQKNIPVKLLDGHYVEDAGQITGGREVILSEYLISE